MARVREASGKKREGLEITTSEILNKNGWGNVGGISREEAGGTVVTIKDTVVTIKDTVVTTKDTVVTINRQI